MSTDPHIGETTYRRPHISADPHVDGPTCRQTRILPGTVKAKQHTPPEDIKANILQTRRVKAVCAMPSRGVYCMYSKFKKHSMYDRYYLLPILYRIVFRS